MQQHLAQQQQQQQQSQASPALESKRLHSLLGQSRYPIFFDSSLCRLSSSVWRLILSALLVCILQQCRFGSRGAASAAASAPAAGVRAGQQRPSHCAGQGIPTLCLVMHSLPFGRSLRLGVECHRCGSAGFACLRAAVSLQSSLQSGLLVLFVLFRPFRRGWLCRASARSLSATSQPGASSLRSFLFAFLINLLCSHPSSSVALAVFCVYYCPCVVQSTHRSPIDTLSHHLRALCPICVGCPTRSSPATLCGTLRLHSLTLAFSLLALVLCCRDGSAPARPTVPPR